MTQHEPTTAQPAFDPRNGCQVTIIGTFETQRDRKRTRTMRNRHRGQQTIATIQTMSAFGDPFALNVDLSGIPAVQFVMRQFADGTRVKATGVLQQVQSVDARYLNHVGDQMRIDNEMIVRLSAIEALPEDDLTPDVCVVQLQGQVRTTIRRYRHQTEPMAIATMLLEVQQQTAHTLLAGSYAKRSSISACIPADHEEASALFVRGNKVFAEGVLEIVDIRQRGDDVEQALAAYDAEWEATTDDTRSLRRAAYARQRLAYRSVLRVVIGHVQLISGAHGDIATALEQTRSQARRRIEQAGERAQTAAARPAPRQRPRRVAEPAADPALDAAVAAGGLADDPET